MPDGDLVSFAFADAARLRATSDDGSMAAEFVPQANMLCCSLIRNGIELLDQGRGVQAYGDRGKTMGIPLLHPWANRLAEFGYAVAGKTVTLSATDPRIPHDRKGLPIHGVVPGLLRWELDPAGGGAQISARLEWGAPDLLELFPFAHELRLRATVSPDGLSIETILRATGEDAVPVSFGFHPYLRLPGIPRQRWKVTLGASQRMLLDRGMIPTGVRVPLEQRSFTLGETSLDDGLAGLGAPPRFEVAADDLALTVEFQHGYSYAQVYAPAGKELICFEPMTAPASALISGDGLSLVAPGEEYRAAFSIAVAGEFG